MSKNFDEGSTCDKRLFKFNNLLENSRMYNYDSWGEEYEKDHLITDLEKYVELYPDDHSKISDTIIYAYNNDYIDKSGCSKELLNIFAIYIDINQLFEFCILYRGYPGFIIKEFLNNYSDKLDKNIPWFSYLLEACYEYNELIYLTENFLEFGFKLNTLDYRGQNELHHASYFYIWSDQYDIMEYLVNKGVDINHKCRDGCTPLDCFEYCVSNYGYDKKFEEIRKLLR